MIGTPLHRLGLGALLGMGLALPAWAQDAGTLDQETAAQGFRKPAYSPPAGRNFPVRPFFGDTHLHTSFSMDAGAFGARLTPQDAYRFAKGHEITASSGQRAKLARPLDFLVVADHSDNMGFFPQLFAGKPEMLADPTGRRWYDMIQTGKGADAALEIIGSFSQGTFPKALASLPGTPAYRSAWQETIKAAEEANDPGRFTAFIGYEWTSNTGGNNLHRNVIFRDGAARASLVEPFTTQKPLGSDNPRDLWKWMQAYEEKTGGDVLAIAHNGNLSNGRMFPMIEPGTGKPVDREYAETRARWERLYEATQIKGDGEAHPFLSPNDEFANFERWDKGNLDLSELKTPEMLEYEYARSGLKLGLKLEQELGTNPYKFGMIGSTDAHTGLAAVDEDNFFGKTSASEPSPERATHPFVKAEKATIMGWEQTSSGLCGGLGDREHPRGALRRHGAPRDLRHDGPAHDRALLRRLGLRGGGRAVPQPGGGRLPEGRADGRRSQERASRPRAGLPGRRAEGPARGQSRPHPDRQGLDDEGRQAGREGLRRRLGRRRPAQARRRRKAAAGREHRRRGERDLGQHHRRSRTDHRVAGPGVRSRRSAPSTTPASLRSRRRGGPPTTPSTSASRCRRRCPRAMQERAYTSPIWYTPG